MQTDFQITFGNLSDADKKCLDAVVSSTSEWLNSVIQAQVDFGRIGIVNNLKEYCFQNGVIPAATTDEKIEQAYALGLVVTAAEQQARMEAEQAAQVAEEAGGV